MNLADAGWTPSLDAAFAPHRAAGLEPARVALELNHIYRVWTESGEMLAEVAGKLRHEAAGQHELPAVGNPVAHSHSPVLHSAAFRHEGIDAVYDLEPMPANLTYHSWAAGTKLQYIRAVLSVASSVRSADLIICGHLNLLPFAQMLGLRFGCPVLPVCYGAEAYTPTEHRTSNYLCRRLDAFRASGAGKSGKP